jgi:ribosomal RNA-processing protein 9
MAPSSRSGRPASVRGGGGRGGGRGGGGGRGVDVDGTTRKRRGKLVVDLSSSGGGGGKRRQHGEVDDDDDDGGGGAQAPTLLDDEDVMSDDDDDDDDNFNAGSDDDDDEEEEEETADAKRLRLAREYLDGMEANRESSSSEEEEEDGEQSDGGEGGDGTAEEDGIGRRVAEERLRRSGLLELRVADSVASGIRASRLQVAAIGEDGTAARRAPDDDAEREARSWLDAGVVSYRRGCHDLPPTCVSLSRDGRYAFSGSKDGSLVMWDLAEDADEAGGGGARGPSTTTTLLRAIGRGDGGDGNRREILAVAASDDGRYLAVGGRDDKVRIFDVRTTTKNSSSSSSSSCRSPVATFEGHKKAVTALAYRPRTLDLYSGSDDRCVRRYDLNSMTYVETLYGHQSPISDVSIPNKNRPVTVSRGDRTARVWKVEEDSHLVYRPGGDVGGAECVTAIRDGWFVTGHDDGRLALWKEEKKRPVATIAEAHGRGGGVPRGIACCDALGLSDVLATGSNDGYLRFWRVSVPGLYKVYYGSFAVTIFIAFFFLAIRFYIIILRSPTFFTPKILYIVSDTHRRQGQRNRTPGCDPHTRLHQRHRDGSGGEILRRCRRAGAANGTLGQGPAREESIRDYKAA